MENVDIYSRLQKLPLFLGMSKSDLDQVVGRAKFEFLNLSHGKTLVHEGESCLHLHFLLKGEMRAIRSADDHRFVVSETVTAPDMFQAEVLWGLHQRYTYTFTTLRECLLVRIDKPDTLRLVEESEIFRLNILNAVTTRTQQLVHQSWYHRPHGIQQKLVRFFVTHCRRPAGEKHFNIKMTQLAHEIGESRLNVSRALHQMQKENLLFLGRAEIDIPFLEKLQESRFLPNLNEKV